MKIFGMGAPELIIVVACLAIPIALGIVAKNFGSKKGYSPVVCFLAGFFLSAIGLIIVLVLPDKNAAKSNAADELMGYKRLLDSGAITQEEFEAKKREML